MSNMTAIVIRSSAPQLAKSSRYLAVVERDGIFWQIDRSKNKDGSPHFVFSKSKRPEDDTRIGTLPGDAADALEDHIFEARKREAAEAHRQIVSGGLYHVPVGTWDTLGDFLFVNGFGGEITNMQAAARFKPYGHHNKHRRGWASM